VALPVCWVNITSMPDIAMPVRRAMICAAGARSCW
jgi:hypothetical protein